MQFSAPTELRASVGTRGGHDWTKRFSAIAAEATTGWSSKDSMKLHELLEVIPAFIPAVALKWKGTTFVQPFLVADVEYSAWTQDRILRHPSFKGVRKLESGGDVYEITPP